MLRFAARMFRFFARWYPLLTPVLMLPIGTAAGAIAGHGDASLGHVVIPHVYPPWRAIEWLRTPGGMQVGTPRYQAALTAAEAMAAVFFATFLAMLIERSRGRDFGWFINALFFLIMLQHDISNTANAYNSSTDYLGEGGIVDRSTPKKSRETKRKT